MRIEYYDDAENELDIEDMSEDQRAAFVAQVHFDLNIPTDKFVIRQIRRKDMDTYEIFQLLEEQLKSAKPNDRSDLDRLYAIVLTDFTKTIGFFDHYILQRPYDGEHDTSTQNPTSQ